MRADHNRMMKYYSTINRAISGRPKTCRKGELQFIIFSNCTVGESSYWFLGYSVAIGLFLKSTLIAASHSQTELFLSDVDVFFHMHNTSI